MRGIERPAPARKWVVIHGHFYQPPRENPWLDTIERQPSAAPFHDWNERIYSECYRPNGFSRLLDPDGMITDIHNNYALMSFNFGPTLMEWIEAHHPAATQRIIEGDRLGISKNDGHGNAIAQVYNHMIMPLASYRDQLTQIRWAKASFKKTFGRDPEGLWLAETAINMETVRCLIKEKISYVILAPQQADSFRVADASAEWTSTSGQPIDTRRPYRLYLRNSNGKKEGGSLDVFFFDEPLSKEVSFNDLLQDAHTLGRRIDACYSPEAKNDEVVVIATDGETFGHHKPFGDMCLAYFFTHVAPAIGIRPINFGRYLALHPPQYEVTIKNAFGEGTAWSCAHGVGRWSRDCGCQTGGKPEWNQAWRSPLREALDTLQEAIDETFIAACDEAGLDPWNLRDAFYEQTRNGSPKQWERFLHARTKGRKLTKSQMSRLRRLCEAQKYMLFSFTSCGWFFAEISGLEPMQNLAYACRALQLGIDPAQQEPIQEAFLHILAKAKSNIGADNGATLYKKYILPFYRHDRMIGFSMALEHALGIAEGSKCKRYGYGGSVETLRVDPALRSRNGSPASELLLYRVVLTHDQRGEESDWMVVIELADGSEPAGWVLPWEGSIDPALLTHTALERHADAAVFTPAVIFHSLRHDLSSIFLRKIAGHSSKPFAAWFNANRKDLSLLQSFHDETPDHFRAPLQFIFQQNWDHTISRLADSGTEDSCISELTVLHEQMKYLDLAIDPAESAQFCERLLCEELSNFSKSTLDGRVCDRIGKLLNIVDKYSLPVSKHRLEDMFFPVLSGPVKKLHQEIIADSGDSDDKRKLLLKLLEFAHRMNFSTNGFSLS